MDDNNIKNWIRNKHYYNSDYEKRFFVYGKTTFFNNKIHIIFFYQALQMMDIIVMRGSINMNKGASIDV